MSVTPEFLHGGYRSDGHVNIDELVDSLRITKAELAMAAGLSRDAVSKKSRLESTRTQQRLRELVEIINRVLPWAGSLQLAFAWYRSQPLPSFGGMTPEDLVKAGRAEAVRHYLSRVNAGGYT